MRIERQTSGRYIIHGTENEVRGYGDHLEANGYRQVGRTKSLDSGNNCRAVYAPGNASGRKETDGLNMKKPLPESGQGFLRQVE